MSKPLWEQSEQRIKDSNMYRFMQGENQKYGNHFADYDGLYQWSVDNIADSWGEMWRFADIKASKAYQQVIDDPGKMPGAH